MKNFKEYLEIQESIILFKECDSIDENWLNAAISGVGNVGSQIGRGTGNILGGIYNTGMGAMQTGVGAIQGVGGGFKKGGANIQAGLKRTGGGLSQGLMGATQIVASPISGAVRAAQANDEDLLTKTDSDRTPFQKMFGLNSWEAKEKQQGQEEERKSNEFAKHMSAYKTAKTDQDKAKAVMGMRKAHPEKFQQLRKVAENRRAAQIRKNRAELRKRAMSGNSSMRIADAV